MSDPVPTQGHACAPAPLPTGGGGGGSSSDPGQAVMSKKAWDMPTDGKALVLSYYFLEDDATKKQKAVNDTITAGDTWSKYANVRFEKTSVASNAQIRISFKGQGSWSYIGKDATKITDLTQPTLNLGWLADNEKPTAEDAGTILHEFGHALGLMHEHQSPARGGKITLNLLAVYNYYRPLLSYNDALVKSQVVDVYDSADVANYSELDLDSIMMYFMPAKLNQQQIEVGVNTKLSEVDKAFIMINYPGNTSSGMTINKALNIAKAPKSVSGEYQDALNNKDIPKARTVFSTWNVQTNAVRDVNATYLRTVDPAAGAQNGIFDSFKKILSNPIVTSVVKNVVGSVLQSRAIPTQNAIPAATPSNTRDVIGTFISSADFAKEIHKLNTHLIGYENPKKPWPPTIG